MNRKVIFLIAVCILFAGILSAGCTSTSINTDKTGNYWTQTDSDKTVTIAFYPDGTGIREKTELGIPTSTRTFTWERAGPYYTLVFSDGDTDTLTLTNGTLVHDGNVYLPGKTGFTESTTPEPEQDTKICGTWIYNGSDVTTTFVINEDGTGYRIKNNKKLVPITWKKTGSHYYTVFFENGEDDTLVYSGDTLDRDGETYFRST